MPAFVRTFFDTFENNPFIVRIFGLRVRGTAQGEGITQGRKSIMSKKRSSSNLKNALLETPDVLDNPDAGQNCK
jgi:hypothetical protein